MNIQRIRDVLSIPPANRRDFEIRMVMEWLRTKVNIFKDVKDNILVNLVKECFTVSKEEHEIIIREGDIGDCMYILMSGYLHIYRKRDYVESDDSKKQTRKDGPVGDTSVTFYPDRSPLGEDIVLLNAPGTVFGEVALIEDCPRTASIVADSAVVLLLVERDLYNRTVRSVIEAEFQTKLDFINNDPLFRQWNLKFKNQLAMSLDILHFDYDAMVVRQGYRVNSMYFILQGEVLLSTCPDQHVTQYPKLSAQITNGDSDSKSQRQRKFIDIAYLDGRDSIKSSCLGDVECLAGLDSYAYTAMTTQVTVALKLNMKNLDRLIAKRAPQVVRRMRTIALRRVEAWLQRTGEQVPLLHVARQRLQIDSPTINFGPGEAAALGDGAGGKPKARPRGKNAGKFVLPKWGPLVDQTGPGTVFHYIRVQEQLRRKANRAMQRGPGKTTQQTGELLEPGHHHEEDLDDPDGLSLIRIEPVYDAQTSESALSSLESKMREFLDDTPKSSNPKPNVVKLARYTPEDARPLPKGGYVVMLRPRPVLGFRGALAAASSERFPELPGILMKHRPKSGGGSKPKAARPCFDRISPTSDSHPSQRNLTLFHCREKTLS